MKRKSSPAVRGVTIINCLPAATQPRQHSGKKRKGSVTRPIILTLSVFFPRLRQLKQASLCGVLFNCFLTHICRAGAKKVENKSSESRPITASLKV